MPRRCSVPGCRSNYRDKRSISKYVSCYGFPSDLKTSNKWLIAIGRRNFVPNYDSAVCAKHFDESSFSSEDTYRGANGELKVFKFAKPKLKNDAVPSLFLRGHSDGGRIEKISDSKVNMALSSSISGDALEVDDSKTCLDFVEVELKDSENERKTEENACGFVDVTNNRGSRKRKTRRCSTRKTKNRNSAVETAVDDCDDDYSHSSGKRWRFNSARKEDIVKIDDPIVNRGDERPVNVRGHFEEYVKGGGIDGRNPSSNVDSKLCRAANGVSEKCVGLEAGNSGVIHTNCGDSYVRNDGLKKVNEEENCDWLEISPNQRNNLKNCNGISKAVWCRSSVEKKNNNVEDSSPGKTNMFNLESKYGGNISEFVDNSNNVHGFHCAFSNIKYGFYGESGENGELMEATSRMVDEAEIDGENDVEKIPELQTNCEGSFCGESGVISKNGCAVGAEDCDLMDANSRVVDVGKIGVKIVAKLQNCDEDDFCRQKSVLRKFGSGSSVENGDLMDTNTNSKMVDVGKIIRKNDVPKTIPELQRSGAEDDGGEKGVVRKNGVENGVSMDKNSKMVDVGKIIRKNDVPKTIPELQRSGAEDDGGEKGVVRKNGVENGVSMDTNSKMVDVGKIIRKNDVLKTIPELQKSGAEDGCFEKGVVRKNGVENGVSMDTNSKMVDVGKIIRKNDVPKTIPELQRSGAEDDGGEKGVVRKNGVENGVSMDTNSKMVDVGKIIRKNDVPKTIPELQRSGAEDDGGEKGVVRKNGVENGVSMDKNSKMVDVGKIIRKNDVPKTIPELQRSGAEDDGGEKGVVRKNGVENGVSMDTNSKMVDVGKIIRKNDVLKTIPELQKSGAEDGCFEKGVVRKNGVENGVSMDTNSKMVDVGKIIRKNDVPKTIPELQRSGAEDDGGEKGVVRKNGVENGVSMDTNSKMVDVGKIIRKNDVPKTIPELQKSGAEDGCFEKGLVRKNGVENGVSMDTNSKMVDVGKIIRKNDVPKTIPELQKSGAEDGCFEKGLVRKNGVENGVSMDTNSKMVDVGKIIRKNDVPKTIPELQRSGAEDDGGEKGVVRKNGVENGVSMDTNSKMVDVGKIIRKNDVLKTIPELQKSGAEDGCFEKGLVRKNGVENGVSMDTNSKMVDVGKIIRKNDVPKTIPELQRSGAEDDGGEKGVVRKNGVENGVSMDTNSKMVDVGKIIRKNDVLKTIPELQKSGAEDGCFEKGLVRKNGVENGVSMDTNSKMVEVSNDSYVKKIPELQENCGEDGFCGDKGVLMKRKSVLMDGKSCRDDGMKEPGVSKVKVDGPNRGFEKDEDGGGGPSGVQEWEGGWVVKEELFRGLGLVPRGVLHDRSVDRRHCVIGQRRRSEAVKGGRSPSKTAVFYPPGTAMFDTERFIGEIQKRPAIYDVRSKVYSNRVAKLKYWHEVGKEMYRGWDALDQMERRTLVKELQIKWKSIRDHFMRQLKQNMNGEGPKKKKYVHFDQLQFLTANLGVKRPRHSCKPPKHEPEEEYMELTPELPEERHFSFMTSVERPDYDEREVPVAAALLPHQPEDLSYHPKDVSYHHKELSYHKELEGDRMGNKMFLLSLLPIMERLPDHSNIRARLQLMEVLQTFVAHEDSSHRDFYNYHDEKQSCGDISQQHSTASRSDSDT